jgi:hypothetical protein
MVRFAFNLIWTCLSCTARWSTRVSDCVGGVASEFETEDGGLKTPLLC